MFAPPRNLRDELLDLDQAPFEEVKDSLNDVRRVNRYLSGYKVLLHHMRPFLESQPEGKPLTVLDVATGSADQPIELVRLARRMKRPIRVVGLDINAKMLHYAQEETRRYPEIRFVQGDAKHMPFPDGAFDVVINNLALHHFSEENAVTLLEQFTRLSKRGVVVNDLHRSRVAWASIYILTRLLTNNRLTRYDAPVSVMNAFTPGEIADLARKAGWRDFQVHRHFPYRIALVETKRPEPA
ncbi:Methyltransferase type 11 [Nitrospina gracilis 3/211]|uniref:Methyltransferase type 11 n=1 Tax=Nitrospina gracilis (strain 3/211) TaxID=1266370 RepID=M1YKV5_NITG3|nr:MULTISPECIES: methyltransferase domain-containing protein [Nitrospina]MCF8724005.1 ubiquinone/menaquinone biosynthesis C-methylase UbiE [Nitrospina sp. Nb-3]CCQ91131.1 Methyltransferase type 11 [Nitrospina gracilis 3/211]